MRVSISFITLTVSLLLSQLTQSVSRKEYNDPVAQTCVQASFLKDYLQHIQRSSQYPGSIFILTDCISSFNTQEFKSLEYSSLLVIANITILHKINAHTFRDTKPFILLDLPEPLIEHTTKKFYETYYQFNEERMQEWLPTVSIIWKSAKQANEQYKVLQDVFKTTTFYFDTNIFAFFVEPSSDRIQVWEIYNIKSKRVYNVVDSISKKELEKIGTDNLHLSTLHENLESIAKRRRNFNLERSNVISTYASQFDPKYQEDWSGVRIIGENKYFLTGGYVAALYWDLQLLMNFSEHISLGDSPYAFPNGTLGGITVHQLNSDEVDLTLNQISFSQQRAKSLTFLQPTYYSLTHVFFKQPSTNSVRDIVITAFQKELWITLIGVWAILVISTKVCPTFLHKNNFLLQSQYISAQLNDQKFANESVLWSVAVFCQKTWYLDPSSFSLRMKFLIGSLVGFLSYTAYSGSIVSSLAVNKMPVKSFVDLINFNFIFTVHEQSEPFQTMLRGMIKSYALTQDVKTISTITEVSHLFDGNSNSGLQSTKKAFLSPADMFYKTAADFNYTDSFICDHISSFSTGTYPSKSAMLVKKGSQFKEVLNYMLIYLRQRGLIYRNIDNYNRNNFLRCLPMDEQDSQVEPATWIDVFTIFLIFFVGLSSAIVLLFLEIAYICYCDWKSGSFYKNTLLDDVRNQYYAGNRTIEVYYVE